MIRQGNTEWNISLLYGRTYRAPWWGKIQSNEELLEIVVDYGRKLGVKVTPFFSHSEAELVDQVYKVANDTDAYIVNPGTHTFYGRTLQCALVDTGRPYVECHFAILSQWMQVASPRNPADSIFTHQSAGMVMGFRHYSFMGALLSLVMSLDDPAFLGVNARKAKP
ncbi:MAG: type II 3-dehydroquinate dehydratase [Pseudorhodoplanes sp.]